MGKESYNISAPRKDGETSEAGRFRTILPQVLASTAKYLLYLHWGFSIAFPTIVIPALRGTVKRSDYVETLYFTDVQASWFGSIAFICELVGSILSGWISEPLGRKRAMIVVNIPHIIAWITFYFANSVEVMYLGVILLGLGAGFMEAPVVTYVGEISQPSIRGILIATTGVAGTLGISIVYIFGSVIDWRTAALICLSVPLITIIAICFVPETPMWLLSKNRKEDALKSLQWLRGWVSPKAVEKEFDEMQKYNENSNKCSQCQKANSPCPHPPPTLTKKFMELKRKRTLKAFSLVLTLFAISQFNGLRPMYPFMVQILKAYKVPIDPSWATVSTGVTALLANITLTTSVKIIGKRRIYLTCLAGSLICCISLGCYAQTVFPPNYNSFEAIEGVEIPTSYFPLGAFLLLTFCAGCGVTSIPWIILSEVFPFNSRGIATGIAAGLSSVFGFVSTKIYLNLDKGLSLNGVMWFYAVVNFTGLFYVYFVLPETENRTLEDIELHFSDNNRKLTDRKVKSISSTGLHGVENRQINMVNLDIVKMDASITPPMNRGPELGCNNRAYVEN